MVHIQKSVHIIVTEKLLSHERGCEEKNQGNKISDACFGCFAPNEQTTKPSNASRRWWYRALGEKKKHSQTQYNTMKTLKMIAMVSYLLELIYEFCLSPTQHVSENPGFESVSCVASDLAK